MSQQTEEARAASGLIEALPPRPTGALHDYAVFPGAADLRSAVKRLTDAAIGRPVRTDVAVTSGGWNSALESVWEQGIDRWPALSRESAAAAHWRALDAQAQLRLRVAEFVASALSAAPKMTNPISATQAVWDLTSSAYRLIKELNL